MKILDVRVMRGPNYWSNYRQQLIVLKLDIEEMENLPTNQIPGFADRLEATLPSMQEHYCSEGHSGGFFKRVREGTWMGHVIEHIAIEIQTMAGMFCGYGRTRSTGEKGIYHVVFAYQLEEAGLYAAHAAIRIAQSLMHDTPYEVDEDVKELIRIKHSVGLGPSTGAVVNEAKKRNIPFRRMNQGSLVVFGHGIHQKKIRASMTSETSSIGVEMACDKDETKKILGGAYIPVPAGEVIRNESQLKEAVERVGFPLVIKPIDGNHGRGITANITSEERALEAFHLAKKISSRVIVEQYIEGDDFRFLVINYKLVAVAKRTPALVVGDGSSTIQQLIDETNHDPSRGEGHEKILTTIKVDEITNSLLAAKNYTLNTVIGIGEVLYLKDTANLSTGGTSEDVTDLVHPDNVFMAERIARILDLDICGIDVVAKTVKVPLTNKNSGVVEVNACPGFRMHLYPFKGLARNVAEPVMSMLYPQGQPSRIPLVAVTGTNGKTTTTRLVAHMAKTAGHKVGFTTTDGIYIQDQMIYKGDCTGATSAEAVLMDPTIDFAVLECARGGILRSGLGFDHCDVSIITNVSADHLGLKEINTLEQMAEVKSVVARSTNYDGYAILNADDDLVYAMAEKVDCHVALFSMDENNERVKEHCKRGGLAAIIKDGYVTICRGEWQTRVEKVNDIPLSFGGRASSMVKNILPAVLAAVVRNFKLEEIKTALKTFIPSPKFTPGRMNIFKFHHFELMVDYVHNTGGFKELKQFMETVHGYKIGIIAGVGDRRDEDIRSVGQLAAEIYDTIIIRYDKDLRGRPAEEIVKLLKEGIEKHKPATSFTIVPDELEAIRVATEIAPRGAFITVSTEAVQECIDFVTQLQGKDSSHTVETPEHVFLKAS